MPAARPRFHLTPCSKFRSHLCWPSRNTPSCRTMVPKIRSKLALQPAESKSRRSSRGPTTMRKQNKQHAVESIFSDNPFVDDFMDWMGSPEGQQSIEIDDTLWEALKNVQLDAKQRKLIWPDTKRLDLGQSVRRIKKEYPNLPNGKIEDYLLY